MSDAPRYTSPDIAPTIRHKRLTQSGVGISIGLVFIAAGAALQLTEGGPQLEAPLIYGFYVFGFLVIVAAQWQWRWQATVHRVKQATVYDDRMEVRTYPDDQAETLHYKAIRSMSLGGVLDSIMLHMPDGHAYDLSLFSATDHHADFIAAYWDRLTQTHLEQGLKRLQNGESITVDTLILNADGITDGTHALTYASLTQITRTEDLPRWLAVNLAARDLPLLNFLIAHYTGVDDFRRPPTLF
jgi:hypothetical protein